MVHLKCHEAIVVEVIKHKAIVESLALVLTVVVNDPAKVRGNVVITPEIEMDVRTPDFLVCGLQLSVHEINP